MSSEDGKHRSAAALLWASVTGFLALIVAVGKAFDTLPKAVLNQNQHWIIEFLPDLLIVLVLVGIAPFLIRPVDWRRSLAGVRTQSKGQFAALCALALVGLVLLVPLSDRARSFYQVRYQRAFIDWHAVRALHLFGTRHYDKAAKELKNAAPTSVPALRPVLQADMEGRLKDAENLVRRFRAYEKAGRSPTFVEVLMVGRAVRLAPQAKAVKLALTDAREFVGKALAAYATGVAKIREGDFRAAGTSLRRSKSNCRGLLHQDLLLRYVENRNLDTYTADDRGLINYYLHTADEKLEVDLLTYPPSRLFAPSTISFP